MYNRLVTDYLEETAKKYPDKIAFSDVNESITWKELVETSKKWADVIRANFGARRAVPVMMEKSVKTIEVFFACVYANCFYSFFDATFPEARIHSMMKTLDADLIITQQKIAKKISGYETKVNNLCVEEFDDVGVNCPRNDVGVGNEAIDTDIVYANFTSGSTGTPKAVVVSHRSIVDFITIFVDLFKITADENIANQAPFDFDVSVKDIFSAVWTGAACHLVPKMYFSMPAKLLDFLVERNITSICWAVSAVCIISTLGGFDYKIPSSIKKVMFSGEVMPPKQLAIWKKNLPDATYVNLYGPTEITCNCAYHIAQDTDDLTMPLPIGKPFPNERVFLLDENDKEILPNEKMKKGELCVSGTCVADGYFNSERTKEVFVQNPLQNARLERIYRTGDVAWYGEDDLLHYGGRKDTQIKHMGHRIELGEIEMQLAKMQGVERAVCVFVNNKITAFYVTSSCVEIESKDFVALIKSDLPAFMVPSAFARLDRFPLTKNGKVDRHALEAMVEGEKNEAQNG